MYLALGFVLRLFKVELKSLTLDLFLVEFWIFFILWDYYFLAMYN